MAFACRICVLERGLKGSQLGNLPQSEAELYEHLESFHHMPVIREGENGADVIARFTAAHPEAHNCPDCIRHGAAWTAAHTQPSSRPE